MLATSREPFLQYLISESLNAFSELEFHLRCHAELLFKCAFCPYSHWQKRTAERHVAEEHPAKKKLAVRDVRKDMAEQASHPPSFVEIFTNCSGTN